MPTNFTKFLIHGVFSLGLAGLIGNCVTPECVAQQQSPQTSSSPTADLSPQQPASPQQIANREQLVDEFQKVVSAWRSTVGEINAATIRYRNSTVEEGRQIRDQHRQLEVQGREQFHAAFDIAVKIAKLSTQPDDEVIPFLLFATHYRYGRDIYEGTGESAEVLMGLLEDERGLPEVAGVSFYSTGQIEKARPYLQQAFEMGLLDENNRNILPTIDVVEEAMKAERERVEKDAAKDDLPRVKMTTTRGEIVIELFEDEAPNTVANFIKLVDDGIYRGVPFYQVLSAQLALAGDTRMGSESVGFMIADENDRPDSRPTLRGYICMAKIPAPEGSPIRTFPNSASSHFFICLRPIWDGNKEHTAFGRVIEGMEHLSVLTRLDPNKEKKEGETEPDPDLILGAEVIRRRDHQYQPERIDLEKARQGAQQADANTSPLPQPTP